MNWNGSIKWGGGAHINSERLRQHAQGLQGSAPDGVLRLKGEVDTHPISNPEQSPSDNHLQMKIQFSLRFHQGNKLLLTTLKVSHMPSSRWSIGNKLNDISGGSVLHTATWGLLLYIYIFFTFSVCDFWVWKQVGLCTFVSCAFSWVLSFCLFCPILNCFCFILLFLYYPLQACFVF